METHLNCLKKFNFLLLLINKKTFKLCNMAKFKTKKNNKNFKQSKMV